MRDKKQIAEKMKTLETQLTADQYFVVCSIALEYEKSLDHMERQRHALRAYHTRQINELKGKTQ